MFGQMFLIHKSKRPSIEKRFSASIVDVADDIKEEFESVIIERLEDVIQNYNDITKFSDPKNPNKYTTIKKALLPELEGLLTELETQKGIPTSKSFDVLGDKDVYCFQLKIKDQRLFIFANVGKNITTNKKYIIGKFKDGELQKIKDDLGVFEKEIFCIYYKRLESLLILDYGKTKTLLAFGDQFKEKCANILYEDLSEMIEYDDKDLSDILANKQINELIVKMKKNNIFENKHKDHFKNWNEFYDKHPLENVERLSLNAENKPEVKNAKDIAMVLYVANNDLMQGIANPGEFARVISKIILKSKQTAN